MKNKLLLLHIMLLIAGPLFSQNNILRGIVKLQSSGSKPLPEVKVSSFGAESVYSDEDGMFEMQFPSKRPGMRVSLIVNKDGYEIINDELVDNCLLRDDADDLIIIVMAKDGEKGKEALRYYNIIVNNNDEEIQRKLDKIESELSKRDESDPERAILQEQIYELEKDRNKWREKAEELSIQMARIDLDQSTDMVQKAYTLFNAGKIGEAIQILDADELSKTLRNAVVQKETATKKLENAERNLETCVDNYMIKARFCIANRQDDEAAKNYLIAFNADKYNLKNTLEIVDFLDSRNDQVQAISVLLTSLDNIEDILTRWKILDLLGRQFTINQDFEKADSIFSLALSLGENATYFTLIDKRPLVLNTTISKSFLQLQVADASAIKTLQDAEILAKELVLVDSVKYLPILASVYSNLAIGLQRAGQYVEASNSFDRAIKIGEKLIALNPKEHESNHASNLSNWGVLLGGLRQWEKAETALLKSLEINKKLFAKSAIEYGPTLANSYMNIANLYAKTRNFKQAKIVYDTIFLMYEGFSNKNPNRFEDEFAMVEMNRGNILRDLENYTEAETAYLRSLEIRKRLFDKSESRYAGFISKTYQNMGLLYRRMNEYDLAEKSHNLSLEYHRDYSDLKLRDISPEIAKLRMDFGNLYKTTLEIDKADSLYSLSAFTHQLQIDSGAQHHNIDLLITQINHAELYALGLEAYWQEKYQSSGIKISNDAKTLLRSLAERAQNNFMPYLTTIDSTLTKYTTQDIRMNRRLYVARKMLPDSSLFMNPMSIDQYLSWIDTIRSLRIINPDVDSLSILEAKGYGDIAFLYLLQGNTTKAEEALSEGLSILETEPTLLTRLMICRAMQNQDKALLDTIRTKEWGSCDNCRVNYFEEIRKLKRINNSIDDKLLTSIME